MKIKSFLRYSIFGILIIPLVLSCGVTSNDEPEIYAPKIDECDDTSNCISFFNRGYTSLIQGMVSSYGVSLHLVSDQVTSTDNTRGYYSSAQEPRVPIDNMSSNINNTSTLYSHFKKGVSTSQFYFDYLDSSTLEEDEKNRFRASAYLLRGISRGYLGLIFDKIPISSDTASSVNEISFIEYSALIDSSLSDLDKAISLTFKPDSITRQSNYSFPFNTIPGGDESWTELELRAVANSFAARILAGKARTFQEALQTNWSRVLDYANEGINSPKSLSNLEVFSLSTIGTDGELAFYLADWLGFVVEGDFETGSGFLPTDLKILHLLDENYPTEYPETAIENGDLTLQEATSSDPRLAYYKNTKNKGYLDEERNKALFSNYFNKRFYADNDWWKPENDIVLFTHTEIEYLKAEAQLMLNNKAQAASILNTSPAGSGSTFLDFSLPALRSGHILKNSLSGNQEFSGTESLAEFQLALLKEYSVELDALGGLGLPWFFMRRHDLLQKGSPTMYPLPNSKLESLGLSNYTFGGVKNAGQPGSASGENSWKNLREKIRQQ